MSALAQSTKGLRRGRLLVAACLLAVAVLSIGLGIVGAWQHLVSRAEPSAFRAPASLLLIVLGLVQLRIIWRSWRRPPREVHGDGFAGRFLLRWLFVGTVVSYAASLGLGFDPGVRWLFRAALIGWYTLGLSLLLAGPRTERFLHWLRGHRHARLAANFAFYSLLAVVSCEVSVRLVTLAVDDRTTVTYVAQGLRLEPGSEFRGRIVNRHGYWDDDFQRRSRPGVYRIAVLGDAATLSGTAQTNYLALLERTVPGIEIYHFGLVGAGPREYAAQLVHEVVEYQPDLVLTFVSVGDNITHRVPIPGRYDWQGLRLYQLLARSLGTSCDKVPSLDEMLSEPDSTEEFLNRASQRLVVCRTPLDETMRARWDEALHHLDDLVSQCARRHLPVALVLVPGEFQVNRHLCERLQRRAGYEPNHLDLEMPQRRLAAFAHHREVPVLDLLPHLRAADETLYERHATDWNETGNRVAADALGNWLVKRYGPQISSSIQASTN